MRPIYHHTPKRIKSHIDICFITFSLIRYAQFKIKKSGLNISIEELKDELKDVQYSILSDLTTGELYNMPSHMTENAKNIYKIFSQEKKLEVCAI